MVHEVSATAFQASVPTARVRFEDGTEQDLPGALTDLLRAAMSALSAGRDVTLLAAQDLLTTTRAAELLSVSRPTLYELLDDGSLPTVKVKSQRRVPSDALVAYRQVRERHPSRSDAYERARSALLNAGVTLADLPERPTAPVSKAAQDDADRILGRLLTDAE